MNPDPTMTKWPRNPQIGDPVNPMDTTLRYRAQSILYGLVPDPLPDTVDEARDVLAWATQINVASIEPSG
jgi:hypothetical protein